MVITVDPGDTTGIAYWTDKGELIEKEALDFDALLEKARTPRRCLRHRVRRLSSPTGGNNSYRQVAGSPLSKSLELSKLMRKDIKLKWSGKTLQYSPLQLYTAGSNAPAIIARATL